MTLVVSVMVAVRETDNDITYAQSALSDTVWNSGDAQSDFIAAGRRLDQLVPEAHENVRRQIPQYIQRIAREHPDA